MKRGQYLSYLPAQLLAEKKKKVTILEMLDSIAYEIDLAWLKEFTIRRLREAGVQMETGVQVTEITSGGVKGSRKERTEFFPADSVVLVVDMKAENKLARKLQSEFPTLICTGDCVKPQEIPQATESGFLAAQKL